ncbi:MAG: GNAT family N-acetyltransferase [Anaerolineae bacterium]|nr:GNAT family N-acetyltransferase [Anaerolineae bacterium]
MNDLIDRIQAYLCHEYEDQEVIKAAPFNIYFGKADAKPEFNLAVPTQRTVESNDALLHMEDAFWQHHLSPRIQFLDAYNPALTALLGQNDYKLVNESMVLACKPETLRPAPEMPGLTTLVLSGDSSLDDVKEGLQQTSQLGFDPFATRMLDTDAEMFRKTLVTGQAFVLRLNKKPVAAGMFMEIFDGLTQVAGLTTLENYRRQGFAAYLTGYMTKYAFSRHVETVFLIAQADGTENVYRRVGFKPIATLVTFEKML